MINYKYSDFSEHKFIGLDFLVNNKTTDPTKLFLANNSISKINFYFEPDFYENSKLINHQLHIKLVNDYGIVFKQKLSLKISIN